MIKPSYHKKFGSLTRRQRKLTCLINLSVVSERTIRNEIFPTERDPPIKYTNPTKTTVNQYPTKREEIQPETNSPGPQAQRLSTTKDESCSGRLLVQTQRLSLTDAKPQNDLEDSTACVLKKPRVN
jgi:hypothetical protein